MFAKPDLLLRLLSQVISQVSNISITSIVLIAACKGDIYATIQTSDNGVSSALAVHVTYKELNKLCLASHILRSG